MIYFNENFHAILVPIVRRIASMSRLFHFFVVLISFLSVLFKSGIVVSKESKDFGNLILTGFYPDPSIAGLVLATILLTLHYPTSPGIPVLYNKGLVHWNR